MAKTLQATELTAAINGILDEYAGELGTTLEEIETKVAKKTVANLRKMTPPEKRTGQYAKGWRYNLVSQPLKGYTSITVYNADSYQLTHLLEFGHAIKRGGRTFGEVRPIPHIEPAQRQAEAEVLKMLEEAIG